VGTSQAGIIGLDEILNQVKGEAEGVNDLERELLALAKDHGNYIASSAEGAYKEALLREYRDFCRKQGSHPT
jgi:hypothetical protein